MSQLADIKNVFTNAHMDGVLDRRMATDMYLNILGALEWDTYDFNCKLEGREFEAALKNEQNDACMDLFGLRYYD